MSNQKGPLITVGIPAYNSGEYLAPAIQSVLDQSYQNLEVLILDNCSTDSTKSVGEIFQKQDGRVRYIRHPENIGWINNFNLIPTLATGEYVLFFADDDLYDVDYIKLLHQEFVKDPSLKIAIGSIELIELDGRHKKSINCFDEAHVLSTAGMSDVERVSNFIRFGHFREWSWSINLALYLRETMIKHPFNIKLIDPGTLFNRSVIFEGNVGFNPKAKFYKRVGGFSGGENYGRSRETIKTKFDDVKNEFLQLLFESRLIMSSKFSGHDYRRILICFFKYRIPVLVKRNLLFSLSFLSFLLIKNPKRILWSLIAK